MMPEIIPTVYLGKSRVNPPTPLTFTQQQQQKKKKTKNCRPEVWTTNFLTLGASKLSTTFNAFLPFTGRSHQGHRLRDVRSPQICFGCRVLGGTKIGLLQKKKTGCKWWLPSRELTYPTLGKGNSSSKLPWKGICLVPRREYIIVSPIIMGLMENGQPNERKLIIGDTSIFHEKP